MNIVWTQNAMADLTQLVENNQRKILLKIIKLINDIQRNGAEKGLGKPEALKHDFSGYWSREITDEDRLVYRLDENGDLHIVSCKTHYHKYPFYHPANYLERKITEVENMLCAKYDYDLDIQVKQEEAFASGISKGISQERIDTANRMLESQIDVNIISIATKMSVEEILKLKN